MSSKGSVGRAAAGKALFTAAMLKGTMEGFFKLIEQYRTQDEPAFCGLARYKADSVLPGLLRTHH